LATIICTTLARRRELDTSVGVSGPHGLAVRETSFVRAKNALRHLAATTPRLHVRDDRETPLLVRRDGDIQSYFSVKQKRNIFTGGLDSGDRVESADKNGF
jgi:hypothetical protein